MKCSNRFLFGTAAAACSLLGRPSVSNAADLIVTASGAFGTATTLGSFYDGHTSGNLAPQLAVNSLVGGHFEATYRFPADTVPELIDPEDAYYQFPNSGISFTYDLFNANGQIIHHGSNSVNGEAIVADNTGAPPYVVDQVLLDATINTISGIQTPAAIYSADPYVFQIADMNFYDYVGNGINYIDGLGIPSNPATYLAFPNRSFDVIVAFGDGDYQNGVRPYQYTETDLLYSIDSLSITQVPEPAMFSSIGLLAVTALRRQVKRN